MCNGVVESKESHCNSSTCYSRKLQSPLTSWLSSGGHSHYKPLNVQQALISDSYWTWHNDSVSATQYSSINIIQGYPAETQHTFTFLHALLQSTNCMCCANNFISKQKMLLSNCISRGIYNHTIKFPYFCCTEGTSNCHTQINSQVSHTLSVISKAPMNTSIVFYSQEGYKVTVIGNMICHMWCSMDLPNLHTMQLATKCHIKQLSTSYVDFWYYTPVDSFLKFHT